MLSELISFVSFFFTSNVYSLRTISHLNLGYGGCAKIEGFQQAVAGPNLIFKSALHTKTKLDVKIACVSSDLLLSCNFSHIGHMEHYGFPYENFQRGI